MRPTEPRICLACERPLPPRRWWDKATDWFLPPPPFCKPHDAEDCWRVMLERFDRMGEPRNQEGESSSGAPI